jgi:hypothetical protein
MRVGFRRRREVSYLHPGIQNVDDVDKQHAVICAGTLKVYHQCMRKLRHRALLLGVTREIGAKGGKQSLETMTGEESSARAKKESEAAAKKRIADQLAREPASLASKRANSAKK